MTARARGLAALAAIVGLAPWVLPSSSALAAGDANMASCSAFPATEASPGFRGHLPDCRAYEMVTPLEKNGLQTGSGVPSTNGGAVNWEALGACCGATSAAANLYRSRRGAGGWRTEALTPPPSQPLVGLLEEQVPVFWSGDLSKTIFTTPASYAAGDERPAGSGAQDLYLRDPLGALTWLSQGPSGSGREVDTATFDGATPDAADVVFSSAEQLTPEAEGLVSLNRPPEFLYEREVLAEEPATRLVDVNESGELLNPYGASLGNGGLLGENFLPANHDGTTTNAISRDGSKIFFESPPGGASDLPEGVVPHLYMRKENGNKTKPLDNPASSGSAQYEGASTTGSLVFFTSDEGLEGASPANELYEFNTTASKIGEAPAESPIPVSGGEEGLQPTTTLTAEALPATFPPIIKVASTTGFLPTRHISVGGENAVIKQVENATE
ncbi:MAG TPA: hypothetical protein VES97_00135, partial [Solirubrobacteraceae bacterium]|nr:hypothetical protein [Solirubrobacteraceae bacterium]